MRHLLLVLISLSLTGCGLTARQAQNLSDGLAGIEAAEPRVAADPVAAAALAGAHDHVEAIAEGEPLPPPKRSPAAIVADPTAYAADAQQSVQDARTVVPWWGWLAGAGAAALGVLRFVPGVGGMVADTAWLVLAPAQAKAGEAERDAQAVNYQRLTALIEGLRGEHTIAMLKHAMVHSPPASSTG